METLVQKPSKEVLQYANELLKNGEIVGIPTETVYGLAADGFNPSAIKKVFLAKGRPSDNPLILHIADLPMLKTIAKEIPQIAYTLAEKFWCGPLTMIFQKQDIVPMETTGGLQSVAVRMPRNAVTRELIRLCGFPLAAPSANLSGLPSPTTAQHVYNDLNGKIPLIIDDGSCQCGVESTVITFTNNGIKILRPGAVTPEMLAEYANVQIDKTVLHLMNSGEKPISPGMKYKHYSPKAEVSIVEADSDLALCQYVEALNQDDNAGKAGKAYALTFKSTEKAFAVPFGESGVEQAQKLFNLLRYLDEKNASAIYVRSPEKDGIGLAVYNRLLRAAGFKIINIKE